ncbi:hypothetical protein [Lentilactobacillus kosonis]|uniref:RNA polymerase sigma-70 region 4 domain-containing protein n=1 Tax=Lentilactobacillus kosonis TaxID=2810561 RepID=A0A401FJ77_9LACO|nr:hypothetical protein [Lentilactobacillus kosonis]GAY72435.1 hypothetical protein NBRC111893_581 [Lentilactobacillus kosonis]
MNQYVRKLRNTMQTYQRAKMIQSAGDDFLKAGYSYTNSLYEPACQIVRVVNTAIFQLPAIERQLIQLVYLDQRTSSKAMKRLNMRHSKYYATHQRAAIELLKLLREASPDLVD